jgi:hypothetical protein
MGNRTGGMPCLVLGNLERTLTTGKWSTAQRSRKSLRYSIIHHQVDRDGLEMMSVETKFPHDQPPEIEEPETNSRKEHLRNCFLIFHGGQWAIICFFCIDLDAGIKSIFENYPHVGMNRGYCVLQEPYLTQEPRKEAWDLHRRFSLPLFAARSSGLYKPLEH